MDNSNKDDNGRFKKGHKPSPNAGRPKGSQSKSTLNRQLMENIFTEADGDAVKFQFLVLKHGHKLDLDLNTAMRLAKELSVYQSPKKASVESKTEDVKTYVIQYGYDIDNVTPKPDLIES